MHIEPGILAVPKVLLADVGAGATLLAYSRALVTKPIEIVKTIMAAVFFSVLMEIFHMQVGPSELHLIGASAVYFTFGFLPTMFGFAIGLFLQGIFFEPADLVHLGVNSLSLILPLIAAHHAVGKHIFADGQNRLSANWSNIVRFDAIYYCGVVSMVGFWLLLGDEPMPLVAWAVFSCSYLPLVFCEPVFTRTVLKVLNQIAKTTPLIPRFTTVQRLSL